MTTNLSSSVVSTIASGVGGAGISATSDPLYFLDNDWVVDDVLLELAQRYFVAMAGSQVSDYFNRLSKIPGKLGFLFGELA